MCYFFYACKLCIACIIYKILFCFCFLFTLCPQFSTTVQPFCLTDWCNFIYKQCFEFFLLSVYDFFNKSTFYFQLLSYSVIHSFCGIFSHILYQSGLINDKFRWTAKVLKFDKKTSSQFSHTATLFWTICANSEKRNVEGTAMQANLHMSKFMSNGIGSTDSVVFNDGATSSGITHCSQLCQSYKINQVHKTGVCYSKGVLVSQPWCSGNLLLYSSLTSVASKKLSNH